MRGHALPAAGLAGFAPATLGIKLGEVLGSELLDLQLSVLESNGRGAVLSRPRITTSNGETATIEQGTEIPYQEATSSGATAAAFKLQEGRPDPDSHTTDHTG